MARTLQFQFGKTTMDCVMDKVDRTKLYGYVKTEVFDENEKPCELATLASDGKTIIPVGGLALASLSPDGLWRDKADLKAVDPEGEDIKPVESSFKEPIPLKDKATVDEYLSHNIRMVYALSVEGGGFDPALLKELGKGTIYQFPFSYRGGLVADAAFMLQGIDEEKTVWMAVGSPTDIQFLGFEQVGFASTEDEGTDDDAEVDFGMM